MATTDMLLTADEYSRLPDLGQPTELVRGRVLATDVPGARHGMVCARITFQLMSFNESAQLGHIMTNNSGVVTTRDPDSVRGPDVSFYSYNRLPPGEVTAGCPVQPPELVLEALSPSDRWSDMQQKAAEYLEAGVCCVCLVDPQREQVALYHPERPPETLAGRDVLEFAEILPGFAVSIRRFFEDVSA